MPYQCQTNVAGRKWLAMDWSDVCSLGEWIVFTSSTLPFLQTPPVSLSFCVPPSNCMWGSHTWRWQIHSSLLLNPFPIRICMPFSCYLFGEWDILSRERHYQTSGPYGPTDSSQFRKELAKPSPWLLLHPNNNFLNQWITCRVSFVKYWERTPAHACTSLGWKGWVQLKPNSHLQDTAIYFCCLPQNVCTCCTFYIKYSI